MTFWGSLKNFGSHPIALIDMGSSTVGGALVTLDDSGKPLLVASVRKRMVFEKELNYERFLGTALKTLDSVLGELAKAGKGSPREVHFVLASPWYVSQTRVFKYTKEKPFVTSEDFITKLVSKEISEFEKVELEKRRQILSQENSIIEAKSMQIKLNGYKINEPFGKRATEIELSTFMSITAKETVERFKAAVTKAFHHDEVDFHTFLFTGYYFIHDILRTSADFIFMDVNGELTDVSVVRDGVILETVSYPIGRNYFVRAIADGMSIELTEAEALLRTCQSNELHTGAQSNVEEILDTAKKEWLSAFRQVLEMSSFEYLLPQALYIATTDYYGDMFCNFITEGDFKEFTITNTPFTPTFITNKMTGELSLTDVGVERDLFLLIESIFITRLKKPKGKVIEYA